MTRQHRPFYGSPLRTVSPGERVEAGWWGGELVTRDYFVAEADDHTCYWIYRERVGSRDEEDPRWFLHGLFG
jgi:protein ImuB